MGRFSEAVFGRDQLPPASLLCGGAYVPWKREGVRSLLPGGTRLAGTWVRYSYTESGRRQILVLFNVYGASIALEVLRLLEDGGAAEFRPLVPSNIRGKELGEMMWTPRLIFLIRRVSDDGFSRLRWAEASASSTIRLRTRDPLQLLEDLLDFFWGRGERDLPE